MRQAMTIRAEPSFPGPERRKQTWQNRKQRFRRRNGLPSGASWRRVQRRQRKKTPPAPQRRRKPRKPRAGKTSGPQTAQQTLPYREMYKDGICRADGRLYTKSMEYEDINCQLAQADDQSAIFDGYCAFLNSFDSSLPVQLSFINHRSRPGSKYRVNIPRKTDSYSGMRDEYVEMLEGQIAKSNNGIVRTKLITFGVTADSPTAAKPRLERAEADIANNFKKLGVQSRPLTGLERLEILHGQLHPGGTEPFSFTWSQIPATGLSTKDFIAPSSFDFRMSRLFRMGLHGAPPPICRLWLLSFPTSSLR